MKYLSLVTLSLLTLAPIAQAQQDNSEAFATADCVTLLDSTKNSKFKLCREGWLIV